MFTGVYTGLNTFNFIRKHFLRSAFGKSLCTYKTCWKWCPRASIQAWTRLILFANTFCRSAFGKSLCTYKTCCKWCPRASIQAWTRLTKPTNHSISAQRLSELTFVTLSTWPSLLLKVMRSPVGNWAHNHEGLGSSEGITSHYTKVNVEAHALTISPSPSHSKYWVWS
jgi:hypothetical protein